MYAVHHFTFADLILLIAAAWAGVIGWRWKRGDFYKTIAEEKTDQVKLMTSELEMRRRMTDITPIVTAVEGLTAALERHARTTDAVSRTTDAVFQKVAEMNGSLRATTAAMQALGDRLILDEAARGLLATAAADHPRHRPARPKEST